MNRYFKTLSVMLLAAGALVIAPSCNKKPDHRGPQGMHQRDGRQHEHKKPGMSRNDENILWAKFDSLTDQQKKQIIDQKLQRIMMRDSVAMSHIEAFQTKLSGFESMTFEEQKALLETREKPQAPMTQEQLEARKARAEEFRKRSMAEREKNHEGHNHEGHRHPQGETHPAELHLPLAGND